MSVSVVFGENLRKLSLARSTFTRVAGDLGINRVQFQRFLRGESFPKPPLLQKICQYFGTDARILTEPLHQILLQDSPAKYRSCEMLDSDLARLFAWCMRMQDYRVSQEFLPDGLYRYWVSDRAASDAFFCIPVQIGSRAGPRGPSLGDQRSFRLYHGRWMFSGPNGAAMKRQREARGAVLRVPGGVVWLAFNPAPVSRISLVHLAPNPLISDGSFVGFVAFGRAETVGAGQIGRCFLEPVPLRVADRLALARIRGTIPAAEVPPRVLAHLRHPVDVGA